MAFARANIVPKIAPPIGAGCKTTRVVSKRPVLKCYAVSTYGDGGRKTTSMVAKRPVEAMKIIQENAVPNDKPLQRNDLEIIAKYFWHGTISAL